MSGDQAPAGVLRIRRDPIPLTVAVELDQHAAEVLGWCDHAVVELAGRVLTVTPATASTPGARPTWHLRQGRGLGLTVRLALPGRVLGRWACYSEGGRLVADLAGPDLGRQAA